jgi:hypothetical protein
MRLRSRKLRSRVGPFLASEHIQKLPRFARRFVIGSLPSRNGSFVPSFFALRATQDKSARH